jgi:hypothetical protein
MFTKRILRVLLIAAVTLLTFNISPGSAEKLSLQPLPEAAALIDMGTAFTYQGRLLDDASPAEGQFDFQFKLFDAPSAGTQIGTTITLPNQSVSSGLFTVNLDFGENAFTGFERWLEINVRPFSIDSEPYSILLPRQQINPTPYATFARTIYRKTVVVKPVTPAGTPLDNGDLLLNTLVAIGDAGEDNPYLVKVEPGIYDLDDQSLTMIPFVDIEGSGEGVTIITADGRADFTVGTVIASNNAELRDLTVISTGMESDGITQHDIATAVYVTPGVIFKIRDVSLKATNGLYYSNVIYNDGDYFANGTPDPSDDYYISAETQLDSVNIDASYTMDWQSVGAYPQTIGIYNIDRSIIRMNDTHITASGSSSDEGIQNENGSLHIETSEILVTGSGFYITGIRNMSEADMIAKNTTIQVVPQGTGSNTDAINNYQSGPVHLIDSEVSAIGSGMSTMGINTYRSGLLTLTNVKVLAFGGDANNTGLNCWDTPALIRDSHIYATGGDLARGIYINDVYTAPDHEITQTVIKADGAIPTNDPAPFNNSNYGVYISSDGSNKFIRDTIQVQPDGFDPSNADGGVGIYNNGGALSFENSTINDRRDLAFIGIAFSYTEFNQNHTWVDGSEIFVCDVAPCTPLLLSGLPSVPQPVVWISTSLLWGAPVISPFFILMKCMWVTDELYNGWGYAADGTDPASYICP